MSENSFVQIYEDLLKHPSFISAPPAYRCVLITIISHACYSPCQQDDHGVLIDLLPGQFLCSIRRLAELANVGKKDVEHALARFSQIEILGQEVRHTKTIYTILWGVKYKTSGTGIGTTVGQLRDIKEDNTDNQTVCLSVVGEKKEEKEILDESALISVKTRKGGKTVVCARTNTVTDELLKDGYTREEINQAIGIVKNYDGYINTTVKKYLEGIIKNQRDDTCKTTKEKIPQKNNSISKDKHEKDKGFYSVNDTSASPLAILARQSGLR